MVARLAASVLLALAFFSAAATSARADSRSVDPHGLAEGPYSHMHMQVQKTFLKVNVATVDIQFDPQTRDRFAAVAQGQAYAKPLAEEITRIAMSAEDAYVRVRFNRDISYGRWVDNVQEALDLSYRARMIEKTDHVEASKALPRLFSHFVNRGLREGDQLLWRVGRSGVRVVLLSKEKAVLLDQSVAGNASRTVLAGYFAPGTDSREPLIRSLLGG